MISTPYHHPSVAGSSVNGISQSLSIITMDYINLKNFLALSIFGGAFLGPGFAFMWSDFVKEGVGTLVGTGVTIGEGLTGRSFGFGFGLDFGSIISGSLEPSVLVSRMGISVQYTVEEVLGEIDG